MDNYRGAEQTDVKLERKKKKSSDFKKQTSVYHMKCVYIEHGNLSRVSYRMMISLSINKAERQARQLCGDTGSLFAYHNRNIPQQPLYKY